MQQSPSPSIDESRRDSILEAVQKNELSADLEAVTTYYEELIGERDTFIWKWCHYVFDSIQLSSVDTAPSAVTDTKTLISMMVVAYDDILEKHGDRRTFEQALSIPFQHDPLNRRYDDTVDEDRLECIEIVWSEIDTRIREAPRHEEFRQLFEFDIRQVLDSIEYSALLTETPEMANLRESTVHECHNMMTFLLADIDLMYSTGFDRSELGAVRRAIWHAQQMARIGNWISTWERELEEGDYSSGVIVRSLEQNTIEPTELEALRTDSDEELLNELFQKIHAEGIEADLLERWRWEKSEVQDLESEITSVDVAELVDGFDHVLETHLATRGLK